MSVKPITRILELTDGCVWNGHVMNNLPHGTGTITQNGKTIFHGNMENGKKNGHGSFITSYFRYQGDFKDDKFEGEGTILQLIKNPRKEEYIKTKYAGTFKKGQMNGEGKLYLINQEKDVKEVLYYKGEFKDDRIFSDKQVTFYDIAPFNLVNHTFNQQMIFSGKLNRSDEKMEILGKIIFNENCFAIVRASVASIFPKLEIERFNSFTYFNKDVNHTFNFTAKDSKITVKSKIKLEDFEYTLDYTRNRDNSSFKITKDNQGKETIILKESNENGRFSGYLITKKLDKKFFRAKLIPGTNNINQASEYQIDNIIESDFLMEDNVPYLWFKDFSDLNSFTYTFNTPVPKIKYLVREYSASQLKDYDLFEPLFTSLSILDTYLSLGSCTKNHSKVVHIKEKNYREEIEYDYNEKISSKFIGTTKKMIKGEIFKSDCIVEVELDENNVRTVKKIRSQEENIYMKLNKQLADIDGHDKYLGDFEIFQDDFKIIYHKDKEYFFQLKYLDSRFTDPELYIAGLPSTNDYYGDEYRFKIKLLQNNYVALFERKVGLDVNQNIRIYRANKLIFNGTWNTTTTYPLNGILNLTNEKKIGQFDFNFELNGIGKIIKTIKGKNIYKEGEFLKGKVIKPIYIGEVKVEKDKIIKHGKGTFFHDKTRYSGKFIDDVLQSGIKYINEIATYSGDMTTKLYEGEFEEFIPHGKGIEYMPDGKIKEGTFVYGVFEG